MQARLVMTRLDEIVPADRNPKDHDLESIIASIARFGFKDFPTRNETTGKLVEGHGRVIALTEMRKRGMALPENCVEADGAWWCPLVTGLAWASDDEAEAYLLAHNQLTTSGGWKNSLGHVLMDLKARKTSIASLGWKDDEIRKIIVRVKGHDRMLAKDAAPPIPKTPVTQLGDVYEMGEHRLLCGSCENLHTIMNGRRASIMVTDPPYGVSYASKNEFLNSISPGNRVQEPIEGDHLSPADMTAFWVRSFNAVKPLLSPGASFYMTGPQGGDPLMLLLQALCAADMPSRHMLIWAKSGHVLGRCDYHYQHEPIMYGWIEGAGHHRVENRSETSLWKIDKPSSSSLHPTMKPVELYRRAIRNSSEVGDLVIEPFGGSGTAWAACEELGRVCYGTEIAPGYCDVIVKRWEDQTGRQAVRRPASGPELPVPAGPGAAGSEAG